MKTLPLRGRINVFYNSKTFSSYKNILSREMYTNLPDIISIFTLLLLVVQINFRSNIYEEPQLSFYHIKKKIPISV